MSQVQRMENLTRNVNALKCVKTQELLRPQVKNYGSIGFTLTYTKCEKE